MICIFETFILNVLIIIGPFKSSYKRPSMSFDILFPLFLESMVHFVFVVYEWCTFSNVFKRKWKISGNDKKFWKPSPEDVEKELCAYERERENYDIGGIGLFFFFKIDISYQLFSENKVEKFSFSELVTCQYFWCKRINSQKSNFISILFDAGWHKR